MAGEFLRSMIAKLPGFDSLIITDRVNKLVEQGRLFGCSTQITIAAGATGYILVRTPANVNPHVRLGFVSGGPGAVEGRASPTVTSDGTPATRNNFFVGHPNVPQMLVFNNPTISNEGVLITRYLLPSGSNNTVVGTGEQPVKFILPAGANFLLKFISAGAGPNEYGIEINWIEVPVGTINYNR